MATNNVVAGNLIGTDKTGTIPVDNVNNGVLLEVYASDNTIGGTTAAACAEHHCSRSRQRAAGALYGFCRQLTDLGKLGAKD